MLPFFLKLCQVSLKIRSYRAALTLYQRCLESNVKVGRNRRFFLDRVLQRDTFLIQPSLLLGKTFLEATISIIRRHAKVIWSFILFCFWLIRHLFLSQVVSYMNWNSSRSATAVSSAVPCRQRLTFHNRRVLWQTSLP